MMNKFVALIALFLFISASSTVNAENSTPQISTSIPVEVIDIDWGIGDDDSGTGYD